jgi:hypothetical protein
MKFSIRDLLLVTVIVALAVGWVVDRSNMGSENARLRKLLEDIPMPLSPLHPGPPPGWNPQTPATPNVPVDL